MDHLNPLQWLKITISSFVIFLTIRFVMFAGPFAMIFYGVQIFQETGECKNTFHFREYLFLKLFLNFYQIWWTNCMQVWMPIWQLWWWQFWGWLEALLPWSSSKSCQGSFLLSPSKLDSDDSFWCKTSSKPRKMRFESGKTSTRKTENLAHLTYPHTECGMRKKSRLGHLCASVHEAIILYQRWSLVLDRRGGRHFK